MIVKFLEFMCGYKLDEINKPSNFFKRDLLFQAAGGLKIRILPYLELYSDPFHIHLSGSLREGQRKNH